MTCKFIETNLTLNYYQDETKLIEIIGMISNLILIIMIIRLIIVYANLIKLNQDQKSR